MSAIRDLLSTGRRRPAADRVYGGMVCSPYTVGNSMDDRVPPLSKYTLIFRLKRKPLFTVPFPLGSKKTHSARWTHTFLVA
jgi:hypothetical protein